MLKLVEAEGTKYLEDEYGKRIVFRDGDIEGWYNAGKPVLKIKLDENAIMPTRAHETDAGLDLYTPGHIYLSAMNSSMIVDTGVHVEIPHGYFGLITSKSGLFFKDGIFTTGTIDEGYTGSIKVKLNNFGFDLKQFSRGEKIAQMVIIPCLTPEIEVVDELAKTERGENGFGSTGK